MEEHWDIIGGAPWDFEERSNRNGMKFNIAKCISMHLGTNNCHRIQQQKRDETSHYEIRRSHNSQLFLL